MDFLDPKKTRKLTIQLFVGYFLVAVMIALATAILVYYAYGFNVNREGNLVQKGLVFVSSQPSGAQLLVDDKQTSTTNAKLNLPAGKYDLTLKRNGYRDWNRNITVDGGDVSHYVYPLLLPNRLQSTELKAFEAAPALTSQSPDRRWLVALTDVSNGTFEVFDLNRSQGQISDSTSFSIPNELMTESETPVRWEVLEWSSNNRHMLLKRYFTSKGQENFEYILADRQRPEGSHNLSYEFNATPTQLTLRDKKADQYYMYDAESRLLSVASLDKPEPTAYMQDVLAFKSHGEDTVLYVTSEGAKAGKVSVRLLQGFKDHPVRTVSEADTYLLDIARYEGDWYVVLGSQAEDRAFIYKNPTEQLEGTQKAVVSYALRLDKPTAVSFSANAQFVLAQNGKAFHVYDLENFRSYRYAAHYPIDKPQTNVQWMDGNRISYSSNGSQILFEYDNINRRELVAASPTFLSAYDREYKYLYTFTPTESGALTLSSTPLRTEGDL